MKTNKDRSSETLKSNAFCFSKFAFAIALLSLLSFDHFQGFADEAKHHSSSCCRQRELEHDHLDSKEEFTVLEKIVTQFHSGEEG